MVLLYIRSGKLRVRELMLVHFLYVEVVNLLMLGHREMGFYC